MRTHYCGSVTEALIDETITLCGWVDRRRDHGGVIFLDMRDREGIVQVVFDPDTEQACALADKVRSEYVLKITGRLIACSDATRSTAPSANRPPVRAVSPAAHASPLAANVGRRSRRRALRCSRGRPRAPAAFAPR